MSETPSRRNFPVLHTEKSSSIQGTGKDSIVNSTNPVKRSQNYGIIQAGKELQAHLVGNVLNKEKETAPRATFLRKKDLGMEQTHFNKVPLSSAMNSSVNCKISVKSFFQCFWIHLKNQSEADLGI